MATVTKLGSNQGNSVTTLGVSPSAQINVGDFIVVMVAQRDQAFSGVADNSAESGSANSYTQDSALTTTDGFLAAYSCRVTRNIMTDDTITVTLATAGGSFVIGLFKLSDIAASTPFDKTSGRRYAATTSPWTSNATATTAQADEVLLGIMNAITLVGNGTDGSTNPDSPWVQEYFINQGSTTVLMSSQVVSSTGAYAHSGVTDASGGGSHTSLIVTYKVSSTPPEFFTKAVTVTFVP
jgi:hypothetical protein